MQNDIDHHEVNKLLNAAIIVVAAICLILAVLVLFGAAKLTLQIPDNATVYVNGHAYTESQTLTLKPGTYDLSISAPLYKSATSQLALHFFGSKTVSKNDFQERKVTSIVSSAIEAYGYIGPPSVDEPKLFEDNTWLAAQVGPSSYTPIALHYTNNKWNVAYFDVKSYDSDPSVLPADVAAYLTNLQAGSQ